MAGAVASKPAASVRTDAPLIKIEFFIMFSSKAFSEFMFFFDGAQRHQDFPWRA